jgi:hypothetical protein
MHKGQLRQLLTKGIGLHGTHKRYWLTRNSQKVLAYTDLETALFTFFALIYTSFDGSIRTTVIFVSPKKC